MEEVQYLINSSSSPTRMRLPIHTLSSHKENSNYERFDKMQLAIANLQLATIWTNQNLEVSSIVKESCIKKLPVVCNQVRP